MLKHLNDEKEKKMQERTLLVLSKTSDNSIENGTEAKVTTDNILDDLKKEDEIAEQLIIIEQEKSRLALLQA